MVSDFRGHFTTIMNKYKYWIVFFCFCTFSICAKNNVVTGFVKDSASQEPLIGASVINLKTGEGIYTNSMGFFSLALDSSDHQIIISFIGYKTQTIVLSSISKRIQIFLVQNPSFLNTVLISANSRKESGNIQNSKITIPVKQLQAIPSILGESDPLKIAQMLPGVQSGGEATPGLFVRGSASDQNLVLIDDAPIYNPFHLFGIFSVVNSDALKTFEITKGGYSSEYGGRLASVVNMNLKEGNKNKFSGDVSLGLATSKVLLEMPLLKNKVSVMFSGRASYLHLFSKPFMSKEQFGSYNFYDFNIKVSAEVTEKTKLYFSTMYSGDNFNLTDEADYYAHYYNKVKWNNIASSLRLNHVLSKRLFWNASLLYSKYALSTNVEQKSSDDIYYLQYKTNIEDIGFKNDFTLYCNANNSIKFGVITTRKLFVPDAVVSKNDDVSILNRTVKDYSVLESAIYLEDEFKIGKKINVRIGGRLNVYQYQKTTVINPEPRVSLAYTFSPNWAIKTSYTQMHQYMHLLTTKGIGLPTDLWIPATNKVPYKSAYQYTLGVTKDISRKNLSITLEGYYKETYNDVSFKEGTSFMQSKYLTTVDNTELNWEDKITTGTSWNYGAEVFLHKKAGKWQGWASYTLSWSKSQFDELNFGNAFYSRQDRRHNFSLVNIYQITPKVALTASWVYITGNPITVANSAYYSAAHQLSFDYSGVNNFRMPSYHRLDVGVSYRTQIKKTIREFEFSVYNTYNRQNPYFYYTTSSNYDFGTVFKTKQVSVLPIIPSINYKISF